MSTMMPTFTHGAYAATVQQLGQTRPVLGLISV